MFVMVRLLATSPSNSSIRVDLIILKSQRTDLYPVCSQKSWPSNAPIGPTRHVPSYACSLTHSSLTRRTSRVMLFPFRQSGLSKGAKLARRAIDSAIMHPRYGGIHLKARQQV